MPVQMPSILVEELHLLYLALTSQFNGAMCQAIEVEVVVERF